MRVSRRSLALVLATGVIAATGGIALWIGTSDEVVSPAPSSSGTGSSPGETGAETTSLASTMPRITPVPILMYHVIADPPASTPFPELWVRPRDFAGQMRWLKLAGFHPVTLRAVWEHWNRGLAMPKRPIVISFDDGYRSHVRTAMPSRAQRAWPGVLNLKVGTLGPESLQARGVRRLIAAGWEIDAHTITHPDLTTVDDIRLEHEVAASRRA